MAKAVKWFKKNKLKWGYVLIGMPPLLYGYALGSDMSTPISDKIDYILRPEVWFVGIIAGRHLIHQYMKDLVPRCR